MEKAPTNSLSLIEWGVAARALPGQSVSGDLHLIKPLPNGILMAVVDGLGHGDEATAAARTAVRTLANHASEPLISLLHRCNEALTQTRGVVMALAFLNLVEKNVSWLGVGNVEGILVRADPTAKPPSEGLLLRAGVIGYNLPSFQGRIIPVSRRDLLIFVTDGIRPNFADAIVHGDSSKQIADRILEKSFKGTDDALVMVVRYLGRRHE